MPDPTWIAQDGTGFRLQETLLLDSTDLRTSKDGYLIAKPRVARTGIQTYAGWQVGKPDKPSVKVFRPAESVMNKDSLASLAHRPITINHPSEMVSAANWDEYSVGHTGDEILRDGEFVRIPLIVMDGEAIEYIKGGQNQLSVGYLAELEWKDGQTESGEQYDAIQKDIRANHIAIVAQARGGPLLRLGDNRERGDPEMPGPTTKIIVVDGLSVTLDERDAAIVSRHIQKLEDEAKKLGGDIMTVTTDRDTHKKASETKDGEIAVLKKKIDDSKVTPEMLDSAVNERVSIIGKAKKVLGDSFDPKGKTNIEIKKLAVASKLGDAAKTMADAAVDGAFEMVALDTTTQTSGSGSDLRQFSQGLGTRTSPKDAQALADTAWEEQGERMRNAWKGPQAAAGGRAA
jgi:uncharacterized protein